MKIVMFGHKGLPSRAGGVEVVVQQLSTQMAQLGHCVTCCNRAGCSPKIKSYQGVHLVTVPSPGRGGLRAVSASFFAAVLSAFSHADVVHIHAEGPAFFCFLPKLAGKRVVVTVHGLDWQRAKWKGGLGSRFLRMGERIAVGCADEIIVLSHNVQQYFRAVYGRETFWIPNGVPRPQIMPPKLITEQFGLKKDDYLLFLGRLVPEKGVHSLIEAYQKIQPDKKLVIAGASSDTDDYVRSLREMAKGNPNILFTDFVQGPLLNELYSNAYLYVLSSDVEGMPLSLLEAMSYGNCCVTSDIPECAEVIADYGVTFPAGNTDALADCLRKLCENPELVYPYKAAARQAVSASYNWDNVVERTLERYHENSADP